MVGVGSGGMGGTLLTRLVLPKCRVIEIVRTHTTLVRHSRKIIKRMGLSTVVARQGRVV
jgi:hypothetical protein